MLLKIFHIYKMLSSFVHSASELDTPELREAVAHQLIQIVCAILKWSLFV